MILISRYVILVRDVIIVAPQNSAVQFDTTQPSEGASAVQMEATQSEYISLLFLFWNDNHEQEAFDTVHVSSVVSYEVKLFSSCISFWELNIYLNSPFCLFE